jgi:16S rRNA (cytosine967-C5)-methyltransferase
LIPVRLAATQVLNQLLRGQGSLSSLLGSAQMQVSDQDRPLLQELCFGTCRYHPQLTVFSELLLDKPLRNKDTDMQALILLGLYQLIHTRIPDHAAIGATVEVTRSLKKEWASKLVNGVLRHFQRDKESLEKTAAKQKTFQSNHPQWLDGMLSKYWPQQWPDIIQANQSHPPFCLRINTRKISREDYLALLKEENIPASQTSFSPYGIRLRNPCNPNTLPLFAEGLISVQDESAQLSADLLNLESGLRVLDACCAPGGKTGHLLEVQPDLKVTALDLEERRLQRVRENLQRLNLHAEIICGDGTQPETWWSGEQFDRILLDAPCSATGIIRRHPDIKILRQPDDINKLADIQITLLQKLWPLLKPNGILLYATCSIMPKENTKIIEQFLTLQSDANEDKIMADWGIEQTCGRQLLPQVDGHDGFYYARLRKLDLQKTR